MIIRSRQVYVSGPARADPGLRFGPNLSLQAEYLYNVVEGQNYYMEVEGV